MAAAAAAAGAAGAGATPPRDCVLAVKPADAKTHHLAVRALTPPDLPLTEKDPNNGAGTYKYERRYGRLCRIRTVRAGSEYSKEARWGAVAAKVAGLYFVTAAVCYAADAISGTNTCSNAVMSSDDDEIESDPELVVPFDEASIKRLKQARIIGKEMDPDGIGYDPKDHKPGSPTNVVEFIKRIERTGSKRIWDDAHQNSCIIVDLKKGAFIFIPGTPTGDDLEHAKTFYSFDPKNEGKARTNKDAIILDFKIHSKNHEGNTAWCKDNRNGETFSTYIYESSKGIERGYDALPLRLEKGLFESHFRFGRGVNGYGTQIPVSKDNVKFADETIANFNDKDFMRKKREWEEHVKDPIDKPSDQAQKALEIDRAAAAAAAAAAPAVAKPTAQQLIAFYRDGGKGPSDRTLAELLANPGQINDEAMGWLFPDTSDYKPQDLQALKAGLQGQKGKILQAYLKIMSQCGLDENCNPNAQGSALGPNGIPAWITTLCNNNERITRMLSSLSALGLGYLTGRNIRQLFDNLEKFQSNQNPNALAAQRHLEYLIHHWVRVSHPN